jgi:adenine-specific DNA-methyltransferase
MGCEIVEKYYQIAVERTKLAMNGSLKTRPMNKPIYDPQNPKINLEYGLEIVPLQFELFNKKHSYGAVT